MIGISSDSVSKHRDFAQEHRLPFRLVSDADGSLRRAFGVSKALGLFPGRVTYVIDREGIVRMIFSAQFASEEHVREALEAVRASK
jgi:peroxiredoxin Q/BCP